MDKAFFLKLLQPLMPIRPYLFSLGLVGIVLAMLAYYNLLWVTFATVLYAAVISAGIWLGVSWTLVRGKVYRVPMTAVPDVSAVNVLLQTLMESRSQGISTQHNVVISPNIDTSLQDIIDLIVRDFILTWYRQLGQDEKNLVSLLQHEVWQLIEEVRRRLANIDYVRFISSEVVSALHTHFRDIRHANTKRKDGDQQVKFLLHPWLENSTTEVDYLRKVSDTLLVVLLPERYSMCTSVRHLLREILAVLVLRPSIDHITNPDYINQTLLEYLEYREKLAEDTQRTYTYAANYEDFVKMIDDCNDIEQLKQIRYKIITEIMHATTISNLKKAQGINTDKASAPESMTKGELLKARNLKRYINQLTVAKTRSEKRIHLLGGPDYQSYTETPDSDTDRKVIPGQKVLSFAVIMESPPAREYLMRYLRREDSDSLLGYWVSVEKLRQSEREQQHTVASDVYQHYVISPTSALRLEKATMKSMEAFLLGNGGPDEFYEVQSQIYKQLQEKHYPSFIVSDVYHQYISSCDDDEADDVSLVSKDDLSIDGKPIYSDTDIADDTAAIASQSFHAQQLLEQLSEKISNKLHAVQAMKASKKADEKILKVQSEMEDELEKLKQERRQLEFHIERTDIWCENVGIWRATIYSAEAVSEGDKVVPNYVILVHLPGGGVVSPAVQGSTQGWVISRTLRDFQALHQKLMQIGSWLKKKELPSMHWFRSVDSSFLENSKSTLQDYLDTILKDDRLVHSEVLYAFLMPTPEYLKQQPLPEKQRAKFFFTNLFKGSPSSTSQSDSEVGDLLFAGDDSSKEGQNKDSIAEPLYGLIREVFELRGVFKWLRKSFIVFVEVTFGRSINRQIRDTVSWVFSEPMIVYYINIFRESMWPDGKLAEPSPTRSDREKMATRLKAKHKCLKSMPDAVKSLVGEENCWHGAIKTFEILQDSRLNKQILYVLLHLLLLEVCPEFAQFLAKEANAVAVD